MQLQPGTFFVRYCNLLKFCLALFKVKKMVMKMTIMVMRMTWIFGEMYVKFRDRADLI